MDSNQFIFNKFVSGKNFIGRSSEIASFRNLINQGENIAIFEPPKTGKKSFILQSFYAMNVAGMNFTPVFCSLLSIRTNKDFVTSFGSAVLAAFGKTQAEHSANAENYLKDTHLVFDTESFENGGSILTAISNVDDADIKSVLTLPYLLAQDKGRKVIVVLEEFQNIRFTEDADNFCKLLFGIFNSNDEETSQCCSYVFSGSEVNAMKDIFTERKLFFRHVSIIPLSHIETRDILDHCVKCFLASGKVLDRELMLGICKLLKNNIYYINHLCFISDSLSKGYIMEPILMEALSTLIAIHEPRFRAMMNDLTNYQLSLLRAIIDGHNKFSSADVINQYNLNSSANVRRLKDALRKKEIITFDDNDNPEFLDPLFEYWARRFFFKLPE